MRYSVSKAEYEDPTNPTVVYRDVPNQNDDDPNSSFVEGDLQSSFDSLKEESKNSVIETAFLIKQAKIIKYWNPVSLQDRKFHAHLVGSEWPRMYKSVCCVVLEYNRAKKYQSRKRKDDFAKLVGVCSICEASHTFRITENPF